MMKTLLNSTIFSLLVLKLQNDKCQRFWMVPKVQGGASNDLVGLNCVHN
jgi:hypothetical protein